MNFLFQNIFPNKSEAGKILVSVLTNHYLSIRPNPITHEEFNLARMFDMRDKDFKQAGDRASVGQFSRHLSVGQGTVIKASQQVIGSNQQSLKQIHCLAESSQASRNICRPPRRRIQRMCWIWNNYSLTPETQAQWQGLLGPQETVLDQRPGYLTRGVCSALVYECHCVCLFYTPVL
ncbi:hypothetical protein PSTG_12602 [Puccinia striiformis f. sp. tritici PST-78]|uniref:Uncharacterized protein n=2 Tax=Puccinia striiformis f. sp. tritici PST-78 TaxID=1165861 RepID=A0A0L0V4C7_9BASI|nr:hypothetical protein PSTG_12602 [Puccinia striiformis f. sp. tritici PST-78]